MTARALTLPRWWNRANKTEQAYYVTQLAPKLVPVAAVHPAGDWPRAYTRIDFQPETLILGDDCRYTPDFRVVPADGVLEFHEVKGPYKREDAMVKIRTAPSLHPYRFFLAELIGIGDARRAPPGVVYGSGWKVTEVLAP